MSFPYYPMYVNDFDCDDKVRAMPLDAVGLFVLCLNESWRAGSLSSDPEQVALDIRRKASDVKRVWRYVLACYHPRADGRLLNAKQEEVREEASKKSGKARMSAQARWEKEHMRTHPEKHANALRTHELKNANAMHTYDLSSSSVSSASEVVSERAHNSLEFTPDQPGYWVERWYARHPKKKNLPLVYPAVLALLQRGADMTFIDQAHEIKCGSEDWRKKGGRFCPKLDEWLTDRGWLELGDFKPAEPPVYACPKCCDTGILFFGSTGADVRSEPCDACGGKAAA